jgi:hypothetical protein
MEGSASIDGSPANNLEVFDIDVIIAALIDEKFDSKGVVGIDIRNLGDSRDRIAVIVIDPILELGRNR